MKFDRTETTTILAGLRLLQQALISDGLPAAINEILCDNPDPGLSPEEIDELCERINCGD